MSLSKTEELFAMKKSVFVCGLLISLGLLFSCGSTPPAEAPEPPPQAQGSPPKREPANFEEAQARAKSAMEKAQSIKANVSVKTQYEAAFSLYTEAESLAAAGSANGIKKYLEAETAFLAAYDAALAKREEAQRQLSRAREAIKAVEADASELDRQQAEDRNQGGSR
jgi:hypothetical protein